MTNNNIIHPLLSICIPTWNRDNYLEKCLSSIQSNLFELDISNTPKKIHCRKLILCTGVYNTEQILKKSNLKFKFNKLL